MLNHYKCDLLSQLLSRVWSGTTESAKYTEQQLADKLKTRFPNVSEAYFAN